MRAVGLHLFPLRAGTGLGDVRLAAPARSTDERVALWHGLPPAPLPDHPGIAPVVLEGEIDGRRTYAEQVPRGVRPSEHPLPRPLAPYVAARALEALHFLHGAGQVHGAVGSDRIVVGTGGEVVLFGRGRQGGHPRMDLVAALSLCPEDLEITLLDADAPRMVARIEAEAPHDARDRLAAWVREVVTDPPVAEQVVLTSEDHAEDGVDEIVPDLGPDAEGSGILDRWSLSSTPGLTPGETTAEMGSTQPAIGISLWTRLSAPPEHPPPPDRFAGVQGTPSRALASLLAEEPPDVLPGPLVGAVPAFVMQRPRFEDQPTVVGAPPLTETPAPLRAPTAPLVPGWVQWLLAMALGGLLAWGLLHLF